jgi:DNA-binding transcriptional regulator PaaX
MGNLERDARAIRRRGYLQNAVLATIGIAGILVVTAMAPNTLQLLGKFGFGKRFNERVRSTASRLARKGFVTFVEINGRKCLRITEAGKRELGRVERQSILRSGPVKPKRWDRRWRLVVFDIPERRRRTRDRLREIVSSYGFLRLQNSVWVFPYDCEDIITLLKADLCLGKDVLYAIVEKVENDRWIRKHFGLPL